MRPILLALSTFRQSDILVQKAIRLAKKEGKKILVSFVVDINPVRCLIDSQTIVGTHFRQKCEREMLAEYKKMADAKVKTIASQASELGVTCEAIVVIGRFEIETVNLIREKNPDKVILKRSNRPQWVRQLFGSPVNYITGHVTCPVLENYRIKKTKNRRRKNYEKGTYH